MDILSKTPTDTRNKFLDQYESSHQCDPDLNAHHDQGSFERHGGKRSKVSAASALEAGASKPSQSECWSPPSSSLDELSLMPSLPPETALFEASSAFADGILNDRHPSSLSKEFNNLEEFHDRDAETRGNEQQPGMPQAAHPIPQPPFSRSSFDACVNVISLSPLPPC